MKAVGLYFDYFLSFQNYVFACIVDAGVNQETQRIER